MVVCIESSSTLCAGEAEEKLREAFQEAQATAAEQGASVVLFLEDCDALCPPRDAARPQEARVTAQLLSLLDGLRHSTGALLRGACNELK